MKQWTVRFQTFVIRRTSTLLRFFLLAFMVLATLLYTGKAWAACSADFHGLATINEVRQLSQGNTTERYIEIKILSSGITDAEYDSWTLSPCASDICTGGNIAVSSMSDSTYPWITADETNIASENFINLSDGMDVILKDGKGDTIDYLSVESFNGQKDSNCTPAFDWTAEGSNTKTLARDPDGTGSWGGQSGNSGDTTEGGTNDSDVTGPTIGISSDTVFQGEKASFTVTLDSSANEDLWIDYATVDATATAGTDYTSASGTIKFPMGETSKTISVSTLVSGKTATARFDLRISDPRDLNDEPLGQLKSQVGIGTILPAALGYWQLDEGNWDGSAGQVIDSTGNGLNGRTLNGVTSSADFPALAGDPGTCGYAIFDDGDDQFIEVADDPLLDIEQELTISAWIYPTSNPGFFEGLHTIVSKNENYEFHLNRDGQIYWWWQAQGGDTNSLTTSGAGLAFDAWHHVAVTYRSGQQKIYVNGIERASDTFPGELEPNGSPVYIGSDPFDFPLLGRILTRHFNGRIDEVAVFEAALPPTGITRLYQRTRPCGGATLDRFLIEGPANANVCAPADISIRALDGSDNTLADYEGLVNLRTSSGRGNWSMSSSEGSLTPDPHSANDGIASYQFAAGDDGVVKLQLSNASADELIITVTDNDSGKSGVSDPVAFLENAFLITIDDAEGADFVAQRDHSLRIEAVSRPEDGEKCSLVTDYDGDIDLKAWLDRSADDPDGQAPTLVAGGSSAVLPNTAPDINNLTASFTQGVAAMTWQTTDVGQYRLELKDDSSNTAVDKNGDPIAVVGSSSLFTVRPDQFEVTVTDNPEAADANNGLAFTFAGTTFSTTIKALGADEYPTLSYGQEKTSAQGVKLAHTLILPDPAAAGTSAGTLSGTNPIPGASFANGEATITDTAWDEVGIIRLQAVNDSYLGVSPKVEGESANVGRFIPHRFQVAVADHGEVEPLCDSSVVFSAMGESMGWRPGLAPMLSITALSDGGAVTKNYTANNGEFQYLSAEQIDRTFAASDDNAKDENGDPFPVGATFSDGTLTREGAGTLKYTFAASDTITYLKKEEAPSDQSRPVRVSPFFPNYSVTITEVKDSDDVGSPQTPLPVKPDFGDAKMRYVRLVLENAYGPETFNLEMPFQAEYFNSGAFVPNEADSNCWFYDTSAGVELDQSDLSVGSTSVIERSGYLLNGGSKEGEGLILAAPDPEDRGNVITTFKVPLWLQGDFDEDGDLEDPTGRATFGVYRGNDRIIYWREDFQPGE